MWDSLVRRKTFLYFSSLPPLPHPLPPSLFPPHFVSRVLKSQCKYILRGIYNSGNGGGSGSPVSAAGWRRLGLGRTCLLRFKGKNVKRCGTVTSSSSIDFFCPFKMKMNSSPKKELPIPNPQSFDSISLIMLHNRSSCWANPLEPQWKPHIKNAIALPKTCQHFGSAEPVWHSIAQMWFSG